MKISLEVAPVGPVPTSSQYSSTKSPALQKKLTVAVDISVPGTGAVIIGSIVAQACLCVDDNPKTNRKNPAIIMKSS